MLFVVKLRDEPHALVRAARAATQDDMLVFYDQDELPLMTFPNGERQKDRHRAQGERMTQRGVLLSLLLLAPCSAIGQDYFPGFEAAAQTDVIHVTSNLLARLDDDMCALDAELNGCEGRNCPGPEQVLSLL